MPPKTKMTPDQVAQDVLNKGRNPIFKNKKRTNTSANWKRHTFTTAKGIKLVCRCPIGKDHSEE